MGYRSEIAFAIKTEKPIDGLYALLKITEPNEDSASASSMGDVVDAYKEIVSKFRIYKSKKMLTFYASHWKWYSDCQSAYAFILDVATNYDNEVSARFARIGESTDDIEEEAHGDYGWDLDYPYVSRSLEMDDEFNEEGDEDAETAK
jgi:hypothetical protein